MSGNIKKLYKYAGKCDDQQWYEAILEAVMISTSEGLTDNNPMSRMTYVHVNTPSERKPLCQLYEVLDVKHKNTVSRLGADKSGTKAIKIGNMLWYSITKRRVHKKINTRFKKTLYDWL